MADGDKEEYKPVNRFDEKVGPEIPDPDEIYNPKYHNMDINKGYSFFPDKEEKNLAFFTHLSGFAMFIFPSFGNILGPLILWLTQKDRSEYVNKHGKAAINFQISFTIYYIVSFILLFISFGILFFVPFLVGIVHIVYMIIMATKAKNGEEASCPFSIPFLK